MCIKMEEKIRKQITLSQESLELVARNRIDNLSGYIDSLILNDLSEKDAVKRRFVAKLNEIQEEFRRINIDLSFNLAEIQPKTTEIESNKL